ncbi:hypothetical protein [Actinacidiphila oryziradicis]|uniref:Uncharacterized protein n=1 Tax=Actinacidiphila oryziradicis TaxID=2571141 RepID=A0A4U0S8A9_9ACTN|nr:hypothetical protein [Actinacidiphila oryziradicis]TKA04793.1 hypothetical protein FCI23_34660 [Actinacidiphila oryziradicis]
MHGLPHRPADRPLPDKDRRHAELLALIRDEQDDDALDHQPLTRSLDLIGATMSDLRPSSSLDYVTTAPAADDRALLIRSLRRWVPFAAAAAVIAAGAVGGGLALHGSNRPTGPAAAAPAVVTRSADSLPVLNGIPAAKAKNELTACLKAGETGKLDSGSWLGHPKLTEAASDYRVVIAVPHLYRAMEDGLATWYIGKGSRSGEVVSCSVPDDAANPNGREAWLSPITAITTPVTLEYNTGGVGSPTLDGKGKSVYSATVMGHYTNGVARVTVQYSGQKAHNAQMSNGVWFSSDVIPQPSGTDNSSPVVRAYDANGKLLHTTKSATASR